MLFDDFESTDYANSITIYECLFVSKAETENSKHVTYLRERVGEPLRQFVEFSGRSKSHVGEQHDSVIRFRSNRSSQTLKNSQKLQ